MLQKMAEIKSAVVGCSLGFGVLRLELGSSGCSGGGPEMRLTTQPSGAHEATQRGNTRRQPMNTI